MTFPLSPKVKELIAQARIVSFDSWPTDPFATCRDRFQAADDQGRYLTDADLTAIAATAPQLQPSLTLAQQLRDLAPQLIEEARQQVLHTFPDITQPGGGLYPPVRAEACWRDFWHFLRCISYGIAAQQPHYTSDRGLQAMDQLYQELQVPLDAMVLGLHSLKTASLNRLAPTTAIAPYFDHLIAQLKTFQPQHTPRAAHDGI